MTCWSDWHLGEVVEAQGVHNYNAYNMAIAEERVHKLFDKAQIALSIRNIVGSLGAPSHRHRAMRVPQFARETSASSRS